MDAEEDFAGPDPLTKHRARLSRILWILILGMFAFIVVFAVTALWHGINRYQVEGLGAATLNAAQPSTAGGVVQLVAPEHRWTEATIVCPYADLASLPAYAKDAVAGTGLATSADEYSYWVTNGEKPLIVRGIKQVHLCEDPSGTLQVTPETKVKLREKMDRLFVSLDLEK